MCFLLGFQAHPGRAEVVWFAFDSGRCFDCWLGLQDLEFCPTQVAFASRLSSVDRGQCWRWKSPLSSVEFDQRFPLWAPAEPHASGCNLVGLELGIIWSYNSLTNSERCFPYVCNKSNSSSEALAQLLRQLGLIIPPITKLTIACESSRRNTFAPV